MPVSVSDPLPSAPDAASLAVCAVSYHAGRKRLLDAVSLRLLPGKVLAVIGPNGAGKSTLLRLLAGEITPSAGEVQLDGVSHAKWSRLERARRVAVLPQQSALTAALTALEVALLGRIPHARNSNSANDITIACAALAAMDADHLASRLFPSLSGGEKSRVQAARVLAQIWECPESGGGRFLLLDEPTAALDYAHQHELLSRLRQITSEQIGVLIILHDLNLAAQYADETVILSQGRMVAEGTPQNIFQTDLLSEVFGMKLDVFPHPQDQRLIIAPTRRAPMPSVPLQKC